MKSADDEAAETDLPLIEALPRNKFE
jgi:hypothetical protein